MIKKRLSKKIWYGSDVDSDGKPVLPALAKDSEDLEGLHYGELYLHIADDGLSLWTRTLTDQIKQIGGEDKGGELWQIRETEKGEKYIFSAFDVATQKGITMYADGGMLDLPSIYDGLPLDNDTIYWEEIKDEEGNVTGKRIKARGGSGEGGTTPTLLGDLTNVGTWANAVATEDRIMVQRKDSTSWVALNLSEIGGGSADFSNVLSSGNGNAFTSFVLSEDKKTLTFVKGQTFALQTELDKKWTTDSAKIANWNTAYGWGDHSKAGYLKKEVIYDESIGCWKFDGDLLVTGGITMFANDGTYTPSTIMDAINVDGTTIIKQNGVIMLNPDIEIGGGSGTDIDLSEYAKKATTLAGYGITDAKISNGVITLGGNTITPLTSHQTIYNLTLQAGTFSATTFDPNGGAKTVYIPTTTSHISEGSNLYFTNARAVSALSDTLKDYVTFSGTQTITGEKDFTGGLKVNGSPIVYDKTNKCWKFDGNLLVTGGITMYGVDGSSFGTIWDNAPVATTSAKGIASFDSNFFAVNNGKVTFVGQASGLDEDALAAYLSTHKFLTQSTGDTRYLPVGGNATTATTASKLSTTSKKVWGVTYWTDGGVPADVSGSMTGVGSITMNGELSGATKLDVSVPITKIGDFVLGSLHSVSNLSIRYSNAFGVYGIVDYNSGAFVLQAAYQTTPTALDILLQPRGGNVAIGKTSATCALDVNGTIKGSSGSFSGNVSMGSATVNGGNLYYDSTNKYWKLEGDLLVTGGVTMYGVDGTSFGTIWDNAPKATTTDKENGKGVASFDSKFFSVTNGHVTFIGDVGGDPVDVTELDKRYVTLSGTQSVTGEKTFESSIKIKRGFSILDDQGWGVVGVNPTEWTGLPKDGSVIGFGTGASPVYIRTSGDDLYHYDKTNDATYKIIDSNNIVNYKVGDSIKFNGFSMRTDSSFEDKAVDANINYIIDATSLSASYFYPVIFPYSPKDLYVRMFSTGGSAAAAYNQNKLEFTFRGQGWSDAPNGLTVHFYSCYDAKETTIGCIAMGEEQGYKVVWVRGGLTYYVTSNITPTLYKDGVTFTNEKYSYGVNYYGGTNTKVKVYWTPQATSGLGALFHSGSIGTYGSLNVKGISIYKSDEGYLFIDGDLVVKGGITMYGTDGTAVPTIWDGAPKATTSNTTNGKGIASFDSKFFSVSNGHVTFIGDVGGLDESALASYLSTNKYLTQTTGDARYLAIGGNAVSAGMVKGNIVSDGNSATNTNKALAYYSEIPSTASNIPTSSGYQNAILSLGLHSNGTTAQLFFSASQSLYYRPNVSTNWNEIAYTTSNVASATTASKLSTVSKTAWGQTYWTSGGVPTSISGDMTGVGSITMSGVLQMSNGKAIKLANNSGVYKGIMLMSASNEFCLGYDSSASSYDTYIDGFNMHFRTGNSHTEQMKITSTGLVYLGVNTSNNENSYLKIQANSANPYIKFMHGGTGWYLQCYESSYMYLGQGAAKSLRIDGSGNVLTPGGITMYSDIRKKTILNHVELSLKEVADAPLIEHYYNSDEAKTTHVGSVAQYWAGLNDWFCKEDGEGFLTMEIQNAALASAISVARELTRYESKTDKQIKKLKKRIGELEEEIENLKNK